jgi:hypothetical protein
MKFKFKMTNRDIDGIDIVAAQDARLRNMTADKV